jgi:hypothetical protein
MERPIISFELNSAHSEVSKKIEENLLAALAELNSQSTTPASW